MKIKQCRKNIGMFTICILIWKHGKRSRGLVKDLLIRGDFDVHSPYRVKPSGLKPSDGVELFP